MESDGRGPSMRGIIPLTWGPRHSLPEQNSVNNLILVWPSCRDTAGTSVSRSSKTLKGLNPTPSSTNPPPARSPWCDSPTFHPPPLSSVLEDTSPSASHMPPPGTDHPPQASESRLYSFSQDTKDALRKFRLGTSRASGPHAIICRFISKHPGTEPTHHWGGWACINSTLQTKSTKRRTRSARMRSR